MKRSEMVDNLAFVMDNHAKFGKSLSYEEYADMILCVIEKAGMLPPNNKLKICIKKGCAPCVINVFNCHRWESEDE